ncbi:MAG: hypothetical protein PHC34_10240 [Candidatus Gastranaerophilales bacterium]|nr:hypothetical protein [Candidatus Gastranaerophilales bacterium]
MKVSGINNQSIAATSHLQKSKLTFGQLIGTNGQPISSASIQKPVTKGTDVVDLTNKSLKNTDVKAPEIKDLEVKIETEADFNKQASALKESTDEYIKANKSTFEALKGKENSLKAEEISTGKESINSAKKAVIDLFGIEVAEAKGKGGKWIAAGIAATTLLAGYFFGKSSGAAPAEVPALPTQPVQ